MRCAHLTQSWLLTLLQPGSIRDGGLLVPRENAAPSLVARADSYDRLVDSPVELGTFAESSFEVAGAKYNVVVHADPADYNMETITSTLQKICFDDYGMDERFGLSTLTPSSIISRAVLRRRYGARKLHCD